MNKAEIENFNDLSMTLSTPENRLLAEDCQAVRLFEEGKQPGIRAPGLSCTTRKTSM